MQGPCGKQLMGCASMCISQGELVCSCSQCSGHREEEMPVWKPHLTLPPPRGFASNAAPKLSASSSRFLAAASVFPPPSGVFFWTEVFSQE